MYLAKMNQWTPSWQGAKRTDDSQRALFRLGLGPVFSLSGVAGGGGSGIGIFGSDRLVGGCR